MNALILIWRSLWRNPLRTGLTIASIAASLFIFVIVEAVNEVMSRVATDAATQLRLVVHERTSLTKYLPVGMGARMAGLPGVQLVCGVRWFGGRLLDNPEQFPSLAVEHTTSPIVYSDFVLSDAALKGWREDRRAALVGQALARRMGWSIGQTVTLRGSVPPFATLEFRIVGDTASAAYANFFIFRLDYLLEALRSESDPEAAQHDRVNFFWVKAASARDFETLSSRIEALFANSPDPVLAEPEEAFITQFTHMFGDVPRIVRNVGLIVLASILFVLVNTISMSIRERLPEFAILKTLGFGPWRIAALIMTESLALSLIGSLLGCLPALLVNGAASTAAMSIPYFPALSISITNMALGFCAAVILGLVAGAAPAVSAMRAAPVTLLRGAK